MWANDFLRYRANTPTRPPLRLLAMAAGLAGVLMPGAAHADLTGDFASALDIDATWMTGANGATDIAFADDGRAVVTRRTGEIVVRQTDGTKNVVTGQFPDLDNSFQEKGLTGIVKDPTLPNGFFFYADDGPSDEDKHRVYYGLLMDDNSVVVDHAKQIVGPQVNAQDVALQGPLNHNGGGMEIYDGHLYVAVGDTGKNATPPTNKFGSCLNNGNGKILRVNLDGTIPDDNPLSGETAVTACDSATGPWKTAAPDKRIYAWGLRNAFRFWVDPHTGRMWIGAVGETTRESVAVSQPAADYKGEHFGYPFYEGTVNWSAGYMGKTGITDMSCEMMSPSRDCTVAFTDYQNEGMSGTKSNCVIGGLIPEGCGWSKAFGGKLYYWFADNGAGWFRASEVKPDRSGAVSEMTVDVGSFASTGPAAIRQGPGGAIYLVNNAEGSVYEVKPKDQTGDDCVSMGGTGGSSGAAGAGAMSGGGGTGGVATTGGSGNVTAGTGGTGTSGGRTTGGASAVGGTTASGGTGGSAPGTGGSVVNGGSAGSAGGGTAKPAASDDSSCGCRVVASGHSGLALVMAGLGFVGLSLRRRRRS